MTQDDVIYKEIATCSTAEGVKECCLAPPSQVTDTKRPSDVQRKTWAMVHENEFLREEMGLRDN